LLEIRGGYPVLNINHGSGTLTLSLNGKDGNGNTIMTSLSDGKWHKIDISRSGKVGIVTMILRMKYFESPTRPLAKLLMHFTTWVYVFFFFN
jgi:hypothetical protein